MYRVAIIDDDEAWALTLKRFFRRHFEVTIYTDISSFLRDPSNHDLVIADFSIPSARHEQDMDGCQLIQSLKETLPHPPILVLSTGFISKGSEELGQQLCPAADAFLAKDAGLDHALDQVLNLLSTSTQTKPR